MHRNAFFCCLLLVIQGCTKLNFNPEPSLSRKDSVCYQWLENIESELKKNAIDDPETAQIAGFPQLRFNRFLASLSDQVYSEKHFSAWLEQMRILDEKSKKRMLDILSVSAKQKLFEQIPSGDSFDLAIERCGKHLNNYSQYNAKHRGILRREVKVPDAYQSWKRVVGLYPLASYFADNSIDRLHRELSAGFNVHLNELPVQGKLIRYSPPPDSLFSQSRMAEIFKSAYADSNSIGIPGFAPVNLQQLLEQYAPVWEIDTRNDTDKIGTITLDGVNQPRIDNTQPKVYTAQKYTRWHGKVLLQLIYQIWFPAREKIGFLDLYGGTLDSVIWRVTLDPEGKPIAFDSIHACGCYYLIFPGEGYRSIPPKDNAESVLSPKRIAAIPYGYRLMIRLQSRTHYVQQISLADNYSKVKNPIYSFLNLDTLLTLTLPNGLKRSLYDEDGFINASARTERFFLWPFGIASPGAMRQWGTHAIAFIGKRHFDDPFLLENLIEKE